MMKLWFLPNTLRLIADRNSNVLDIELQISNETPEMVLPHCVLHIVSWLGNEEEETLATYKSLWRPFIPPTLFFWGGHFSSP